MRKSSMLIGAMILAASALACGHETRTVVRRETVQTQTVPAPVVVERRTVIEPQPERVIHERRTTIEEQ